MATEIFISINYGLNSVVEDINGKKVLITKASGNEASISQASYNKYREENVSLRLDLNGRKIQCKVPKYSFRRAKTNAKASADGSE